jgi:hypothetical protein
MSKSQCRRLLESISIRFDRHTSAAIDQVAPRHNRAAWLRALALAELARLGQPVRPAPPTGPTRRAVRRLPRVDAAADLYGQARMLGGAVVQLCIDLRETPDSTALHRRAEAALMDLRRVVARLGAILDEATEQ